ncbi:MAG: hypothetical protein O7C75_14040 [Verrucomicrobia bacterium]|nr:hypothetical protein [Verrucomicrobiota bacterium]
MRLLLFCAIVFLFAGCEFEDLSVEKHGEKLAAYLGVETMNLQQLNYCGYRYLKEPRSERISGTKGI